MNAKRIVVITGVTRGLGAAMVPEFIARGHIVIGCGRSRSRIEELKSSFGVQHGFSVVDVASDQEVQAWASKTISGFGAPDLLLNNAALINRNAPLWNVSASEFSAVIDVNIKGTANVLRHFLPAMVAGQSGVVVNFSSGWGRSTSAEVAPYCTTKWAIEGLTQALAQELPSGMAAIALNPGIINTEMLQTCFAESASAYPTASEWAKSGVPYLLSLGPSSNGQALTVPS
jgi:NAD(P)-dependent dehydrogenase (short-subunit alcohol dehydrogenase family)